ncbi:MAG: histidinol-phosphate transaminase [Proteobacteria bacterium]|nr:histidinol-phosphate transaminase [Pseudomonadota bacterium]
MSAPTPRPGILAIRPYVGGESRVEGAARAIKLSSNEGALGASPKAMEAFRALAGDLHRYPDGGAEALRRAIGARHGLDPQRIVCGSGSDELIGLLCHAYAGPGDEVVYSAHGFLMYPIYARSAGAVPVAAREHALTADVDALLERVGPQTRIVFLANPNNPTGSYLPVADLERLRAGLPADVLLVVDSAYAEYVTRNDYSAGEGLVDVADNVVMTRTFSKIYGLSALRLGWAYCPPAVADVLNRVRSPFNVNAAAQAAGVAALADVAHVERARAHNETWREWTAARIRELGLTVHPSVCNFLLVDFADAADADAFLRSRGIVVRRVGAYGLPGSLRITIGTEAEMRAVADALAEYVRR